MFVIIQAHEYQKHAAVLEQMFRLRKKVFADQLGWDVPVIGPYERDSYDSLSPAYLVWCNDSRTRLYGGMRLMPTTGPTLLYDVFRETFPAAADLVAPGIWEGTRMCIDEEAIARDFPNIDPGRAFSMMLLALCECALDHGIHTMISNYEPYLKRVYKRAGAEVEELGRADGYGKYPVCCGAFEVSDRVLRKMRAALGLTQPLYVRHVPARSVVTQFLEMAA
ncbi:MULTISPECIES: acyl-homoserine-lactone synthase [Rhizobium]|uniref:acyl-homoserine-lactone synthase n=1 Tax=Rhizobium TaxID=379 RepID=UPI0007EC1A0A|nr:MULTISPECIES: acyl-homoserine-lactone synthase [Rhizobium]ANK86575.1 acyl-homoserine-lactone synthase [Rhizobium sp. N731]ANK92491.1 acyl-homoserine-lactone synthase 1 [Rhizobium sp. N6212]ANK98531.1 acyl-homoserine-lactone synthase 1 [Rhizobium sp. N621]ANL04610.1 acyl-homoserine-lactone synthase 1 [Rhizobium esperanzae]ANL10723.1 acyl-homoserine-lactone synthase 1 [Rhizobium sp. N1341]